jgi:ABC-2 type transport system permease protein
MGAFLKYIRLSGFFGIIFFRKLAEYRIDFFMGLSGFLFNSISAVLFLLFIFQQVPQIHGWNFYHLVFVLGLSFIPKGIDHIFTDNIWQLGNKLIQTGDFFKYLIRPINPLFYLVSETFIHPDGFGELLSGLAITIFAAKKLHLTVGIGKLLVVALLISFASLIFTAVKLVFATVAFWTVVSLPLMTVTYSVSNFVRYPIDIYNDFIRTILIWVLPFAFTAYFPAQYILFNRADYLLLTPLISIFSFIFAYGFWLFGLRNYEMTGS